MIDPKQLILEAGRLAPLPQSSSRLATLLAGDAWDMARVCDVVRLDEALTGRLLSVANSVRAGSREPVSTLDAAVMRLGAGAVLGVALGAAVRRDYVSPLPAYGLEEGALWRHSVAAALAVEEAARYCRRTLPVEAFATALLHDVGKLILARRLTEEIVEVMHRIQGGTGIDADTERAVLEIEHGELGAHVARAWGLPEAIALGIEHHERPLAAPTEAARLLATVVGLADAAAVRAGAPCGGRDAEPELTPELANSLGITPTRFAALCAAVEARLEDVLSLYE